MTHQYLSHGRNYTNFITLAEWLEAREEFSNKTQTFKGYVPANRHLGDHMFMGDLYGDYAWFLREGLRHSTVDYIVYSYDTPIAWHDTVWGWVFPGIKYSLTTTRHQGAVEAALSTFAELVA